MTHPDIYGPDNRGLHNQGCILEAIHIKGTAIRVYCMYTHSREFPCMYPGVLTGDFPVCTLARGTSLTLLQHNRINEKITKQNAAIEYIHAQGHCC